MALSCGAKCAKGVLITFNLVFWLSGCALIAFGIFILIEEEKTTLFRLFQAEHESYAPIQYLAFAFIGIGGLVFIVGFFGCCGAMQENKCMLVSYFIFLFIILGSELAVGVLAIIFQDKAVTEMETELKHNLKTKYGIDEPITKAFDLAQTKFECCGVKDYTDYDDSAWKKNPISNKRNVSLTCCILNKNVEKNGDEKVPVNDSMCQRPEHEMHLKYRHQTGCKSKLEAFIKEESTLFIAIGCGIAALEIFGMIFSICLCKEI